jgi:hypothetical protein
MSYASGGLIQATDYNNFVGTSPSSTANQLNTIWAVGNGQYGYGQTAISQVSSTGLVTATQWASVINTLNSIYNHQGGSSTGLVAPTAGGLISYLSAFSGDLNTAYTNHLNANSRGTTITGTNFAGSMSDTQSPTTGTAQQAAYSQTFTRTATFASADQARYFFNAGGQLNFVVSSVTNTDGTSRSADMVTLAATNFTSFAIGSTYGNGRTGSGGTANTNATTIGYWNANTSAQTLSSITSTTSGYTSDYLTLTVQTNGVQGSHADNGTVLTFVLTLYSAARPTLTAPTWGNVGTAPTINTVVNDTITVTVNHRIDVIPPESTNLSNSWGTVTIA